MRKLGLEYLSAFGLHPAEFVHLAADLGCDFVSLNLSGAANPIGDGPKHALHGDHGLQDEVAQALAGRGLDLALVEGFTIRPGLSVREHEDDLDRIARMGAGSICAVSLDRDMDRTHAEFALLTELAAERRLVTTTEVCAGTVRNLTKACDALAAVANPSFKLLIDTMHFFRSGSSVANLAALDPQSVGHVQLCDVPLPAQIDDYMEEALFERRAPGDGDLPLAAFVGQLSPDVPIGLEIPIRSQALGGVGPHERLEKCVRAARELIQAQ